MVAVPSSLVVAVCVLPRSTDRTVTVAPATTAFCGSVAFTVICPVSVCAKTESGKRRKAARRLATALFKVLPLMVIRFSS
jgi:hypothetical protein